MPRRSAPDGYVCLQLLGPVAIGLALLGGSTARADQVSLIANRDTMFHNETAAISNGAGIYACVGQNGRGYLNRALYYFNVSSIPAGSTVTAVQFDLWAAPNTNSSGDLVDMYLLLQDWGEAGSHATGGECKGAAAQTGDATWNYRFYSSQTWSTLGGTYATPESASLSVDPTPGLKTWTSAQLVADVQGWVDSAGTTNFGWLIKKRTEFLGNSLRFKSRQNPTPGERPRLRVTFDPPGSTGACCQLGESCSDVTSTVCLGLGGLFQGAASTCATTTCVDPVGACCAPAGTCSVQSAVDCASAGGGYQGDGASCATATCPIVLEPFVDALPLPAVAQPISGTPGGSATYTIAMREVQRQLHRDLPPTTVWGYGDGPTGATYPGPTIEAAVDQPLTIEFVNDLRDSAAAGDPKPYRSDHYLEVAGTSPAPECHIHGAQDLAKTVVHLHGGHVPASFDGYPEDNYLPGDSLVFTYPNAQQPGTLWYHDHALGITRLNVYMGLAGFYLIRDAAEQGLGLPSGEFELPLAIQDRSFNVDGTLQYPADMQEMFFGEFVVVNGKVWPYHDVKQGKYRLRLLNGSGSRTYTLSLDRLDQAGTADLPFVQIGTDGGLLEVPLTLDEVTLAPAERADVIVDFQGLPVDTEIVLTNSAPAPFPGTPGVGVVPDVMKFVVTGDAGSSGAIPATLTPIETLDESASIKSRDFTLQKYGDACDGIWKINDMMWDDITEYPQLGTTEVWRFINPSPMMHPMHMHLVFFQVLDRTPIGGGPAVPPAANELGWKDTVRATPGMITRVIARFEDYAGKFAYHCHILEHEDHEMMRQFWSVDPIDTLFGPTDISWTERPGAVGYDVVRGDLLQLSATGGNFAFSSVTRTCLSNDTPSTMILDTDPLGPGEGFWYLIRAVDAAGKGTYDGTMASQVDYRDDEIALSGNDCP